MPRDAPVLIVAARYYRDITDELEAGAMAALSAAGVGVERCEAPGAFEIPGLIAAAARGPMRFAGFVALGCVIRGETSHYDYVCGECARGLMDLSIGEGLAIGFGVLTVENPAQAWVRARREEKDKGGEAARACLAMMSALEQFAGGPA